MADDPPDPAPDSNDDDESVPSPCVCDCHSSSEEDCISDGSSDSSCSAVDSDLILMMVPCLC